MAKCQHPFAICGQDMFCHYGNCDTRARLSAEERLDKLEKKVRALEKRLPK